MRIIRSNERGVGSHGWLESRHTFSFAEYYNPAAMGFRALRVINEDRVAPGAGFPKHPHSNMEILSYVVSGTLAHVDALGNRTTIHAREVQLMSAGSGITHSEFNGSASEPVHFLQIWIQPQAKGLTPTYGEWRKASQLSSGWSVIASPNGREQDSAVINQDVTISLGLSEGPGEHLAFTRRAGRGAWIQIVSGECRVQGDGIVEALPVHPGDGIALEGDEEQRVILECDSACEVLLFDLG